MFSCDSFLQRNRCFWSQITVDLSTIGTDNPTSQCLRASSTNLSSLCHTHGCVRELLSPGCSFQLTTEGKWCINAPALSCSVGMNYTDLQRPSEGSKLQLPTVVTGLIMFSAWFLSFSHFTSPVPFWCFLEQPLKSLFLRHGADDLSASWTH